MNYLKLDHTFLNVFAKGVTHKIKTILSHINA
ncbi:Uncharacterised protein [Serratia liquefaciens]|nr:Uncharacterised protein [Serratia liquefaciens]CAI1535787.1 Uncharacterised protein [Serratia liquefaciens]